MSDSSNGTNKLKRRHVSTNKNGVHKVRRKHHYTPNVLKGDSKFDEFGNELVKETEWSKLDKLLSLPIGTGEFSKYFSKYRNIK